MCLAGIEELVCQVFFDANVASQHVCDKSVREIMLFMKDATITALSISSAEVGLLAKFNTGS